MSGIKRILNILTALLMIACAALMLYDMKDGYLIAINILEMALLVFGLQQIIYYFSMARRMVGGLTIFFKGIFLMDAGFFAICLDSMPRVFTMVYLLVVFGAAGAIGMLRALEMKNINARWKLKFASGVFEVLIALSCVLFINSDMLFSCAFAAGTLYLAAERIVTAFQKTAIVYVETQSAEDAAA